MKKIVLFLLVCLGILSFCSCNSDKNNKQKEEVLNTVTITFIQSGEEDIVITINEGETLTDIPSPIARVGYTVSWDRTDFTNITTNIVVCAIDVPNEYTITYELDKAGAIISKNTQKVVYNESFVLLVPTCEGFDFLGWKIKNTNTTVINGKWTYLSDLILVAQWEKSGEWTDNY